uniref:G-protein coupled receptors family 1 profile domain-containing protein n=1 Tax=Bos taurus TaxID=9913 RepID=A0A3Q1MJG2_BOVIN
SDGKESACNAGDLGVIPGSGKSPGSRLASAGAPQMHGDSGTSVSWESPSTRSQPDSLCPFLAPGNLFLVSLAFADLAVALYPYPLSLVAIFHDGWALGEVHCKASAFVMGLSVVGSVFNITAIAVDRYCYVCRSVTYHRLCRRRHRRRLRWPRLAAHPYDPRVYSCTFAQTASAGYTAARGARALPAALAVVCFCYLHIWVLVLRARRKVKAESKPRPWSGRVRSFLSMFVVFVIFAICWAPLNCIGLAVAIDPEEVAPRVPEGLFVSSYFLAYFNSCLNAIVYGLLNQNFRREYKRIISALWNPRRCLQTLPKGSQAEGPGSQPTPADSARAPVQADNLPPDAQPGNALRK